MLAGAAGAYRAAVFLPKTVSARVRRTYARVEPATGSESDLPHGADATQPGRSHPRGAALMVLGPRSLRSRHDRTGCGRPEKDMGPRPEYARRSRVLFHRRGGHRHSVGRIPDRPFRAEAYPPLGRLHLYILHPDRQSVRKPHLDRHHALHQRTRRGCGLSFALSHAVRNRPGEAPRHSGVYLQRHPDGFLPAPDALRVMGHQHVFARRRLARPVHRGRHPHLDDLFPLSLPARIPALAHEARTP